MMVSRPACLGARKHWQTSLARGTLTSKHPLSFNRTNGSISRMRGSVQFRLLVDSQAGDFDGVEEMIARQVRPVSHAADASLGRIDGFQPNAQFAGVQAAQPFAGGPPVARDACCIRIVVCLPQAGIVGVIGESRLTTLSQFLGHFGNVEIACFAGVRLASFLVDRRGNAGQFPLAVNVILSFEPAPRVVFCRGPMFGRVGSSGNQGRIFAPDSGAAEFGSARSIVAAANRSSPPKRSFSASVNIPKLSQNKKRRRFMVAPHVSR